MQALRIGILSSLIAATIIAWVSKIYLRSKDKITSISKIELESTPFFKNGSSFTLEKVNYLYGPNSSGKSALSEWISTLEGDTNIQRWFELESTLPINFLINVKGSKISQVRITIDKDGVNYNYESTKSFTSPVPFKFVFLKNERIQDDEMTAISILAKQLKITDSYLCKLVEQFNSNINFSIQGLKIQTGESKSRLLVKLNKSRSYQNYYGLSGSEQQKVLIELGINLCNHLCTKSPCLLIIEQSSFDIDTEYFDFIIGKLTSKFFKFQTLIISVEKPHYRATDNYKSLVLTGKVPNVEVVEV